MHAYHFKLIQLYGRIEGFFVLSAVKSASRVVASIKFSLKTLKTQDRVFSNQKRMM